MVALVVVAVLVLLTGAFLWWFRRSPVIRQMRRGNSLDPAQAGSRWEHAANRGFGNSWRDDGANGTKRASRLQSGYTKPRR